MLSKYTPHIIFYLLIFFGTCSEVFARNKLHVGDTVPNIGFIDIEGNRSKLSHYFDRVVVLSVSDRTSSARLRDWMEPANLTLFQLQPDLQMAYLSIADVSSIPALFRGLVGRIIRSISRSSREKLAKVYSDHNVSMEKDQQVFHLIPDWRGGYLNLLGLDDGAEYTLWVIHRGVVIAAFTEDEPALEQSYIDVIIKLGSR